MAPAAFSSPENSADSRAPSVCDLKGSRDIPDRLAAVDALDSLEQVERTLRVLLEFESQSVSGQDLPQATPALENSLASCNHLVKAVSE